MIMSFIGSIRSVMAGSGLEKGGAVCCGSNTVTHMLSGKAISCALRGFFLVDGALSVFLLENLMPDADAVADPCGVVKGVIASPRGLAKLVTRQLLGFKPHRNQQLSLIHI